MEPPEYPRLPCCGRSRRSCYSRARDHLNEHSAAERRRTRWNALGHHDVVRRIAIGGAPALSGLHRSVPLHKRHNDVNLQKQGAFVAAGFSAPSSAQQVIAWYTTRLVSAGWTPGVDRGIHTPPRHIFAHGREEFILQLYPDVADSYRLHPGPGTVVFERTLSIESCSGAPQYC